MPAALKKIVRYEQIAKQPLPALNKRRSKHLAVKSILTGLHFQTYLIQNDADPTS